MRKLLITLTVVMVLCLTTNSALATGDPNDAATASVTVTVDNIVEWAAANFDEIAITPHITAQGSDPNANKMLVLYTNGNVTITANNTTTAQLSIATDTLVTEYKLTFDSTGGTTGNDTPDWETHEKFLNSGADGTATSVTHAAGDGAVQVTLHAQASNDTGQVADAGNYSATQTLTAGWAS